MVSPVSAAKDTTLYPPSKMRSLVSHMAKEISPLVVTFPNTEYRFVLFISKIPGGSWGPEDPCAISKLQNSPDSTKNLQIAQFDKLFSYL